MNFQQQPSPELPKSKRQQRLDSVPVVDLLKIMRPDNTAPVLDRLPENIEDQYDYIVNQLQSRDLYRDGLKQRIISNLVSRI